MRYKNERLFTHIFRLTLLGIALITLASCKDDDDGSSTAIDKSTATEPHAGPTTTCTYTFELKNYRSQTVWSETHSVQFAIHSDGTVNTTLTPLDSRSGVTPEDEISDAYDQFTAVRTRLFANLQAVMPDFFDPNGTGNSPLNITWGDHVFSGDRLPQAILPPSDSITVKANPETFKKNYCAIAGFETGNYTISITPVSENWYRDGTGYKIGVPEQTEDGLLFTLHLTDASSGHTFEYTLSNALINELFVDAAKGIADENILPNLLKTPTHQSLEEFEQHSPDWKIDLLSLDTDKAIAVHRAQTFAQFHNTDQNFYDYAARALTLQINWEQSQQPDSDTTNYQGPGIFVVTQFESGSQYEPYFFTFITPVRMVSNRLVFYNDKTVVQVKHENITRTIDWLQFNEDKDIYMSGGRSFVESVYVIP